jgi:glycosyltransferase involved in cell wall biosynthesis
MGHKKIVWIAHEANKSGANLCLQEFMQIATEAGFEQLLILPHKGNMELVAKELKIPVKIIHYYSWVIGSGEGFFRSLSFRKPLRNTIAILHIAIVIMSYRAKFVFSNTSVVSVGAWASLLTATKHFWYVHEMGEEDFGFKLPWGKLSYWFMDFSSFKILTNSNHLASKYKKRWSKINIKVVRYAVPLERFLDPYEWQEVKEVKLLLLGQVAETKGHMLALEATAALIQDGYNVNLSIVGKCEDDYFQEQLSSKIASLGLGERVAFLAYTNNPSHVIAEHHILLMCSRCEAFGRVTVEAMKTGIPVVGSNTCGTKEIIEHMQTGYLFEQGNVLSLSAGIKHLIDDSALRNKIIGQAKISAENLTKKEHFLSLLKESNG